MVLVVGGGPSGLLTSYYLSKMGLKVTLVEEDRTVGENPHCGGLVSADFWEKLGLPPKRELVLNQIDGLELHFASESISLRSRGPYALVLSRELFDKYLYNLAKDAGAEVLLGTRAEGARLCGQELEVRLADRGSLRDKILVIAEGLSRLLTLQVGGETNRRASPSFQALVRGRVPDQRVAQVFVGERGALYDFAYFIPINEDTGRLGVISNRADPLRVCEIMMRKLGLTLVRSYRRWAVWFHGPIRHPKTPGVLLVGDAGGFTKPLTGGGIVWGGLSARIAARVIQGSSSRDVLKSYVSLTRSVFWREARAQMLFRGILLSALPSKVLGFLSGHVRSTMRLLGAVDYDFPFSKPLHLLRCLKGELLK